ARVHPAARAYGDELREWAAGQKGGEAFEERLKNFQVNEYGKLSVGVAQDLDPASFEVIMNRPDTWRYEYGVEQLRAWKGFDDNRLGGAGAASHQQQSRYAAYGQGQSNAPGR
ncbi:hypothetical protein ACFW9I_36520, partial [[Kitasatospora] papulosa]|uniref:hypothetical protein n=1 Tax=[Kitasatospora] papulosa TaxID=1464011 RepID=UPI0036CC461A